MPRETSAEPLALPVHTPPVQTLEGMDKASKHISGPGVPGNESSTPSSIAPMQPDAP
jgi:hypothetical protein